MMIIQGAAKRTPQFKKQCVWRWAVNWNERKCVGTCVKTQTVRSMRWQWFFQARYIHFHLWGADKIASIGLKITPTSSINDHPQAPSVFFVENGKSAIVISNRYCPTLCDFIQRKPGDLFNNFVKVYFSCGDTEWPPYSPELMPCKSKVYQHRSQPLEAFKKMITKKVEAITSDMIRNIMKNFRDRLNQWVNNGSGHSIIVLFKTR